MNVHSLKSILHLSMKTADKHDKIVKAAIRVFARNGFFDSRIAEIAKEANVADGTIYLYFNNKYDILITIFEEEMGKIIARVKHLMTHGKSWSVSPIST